jgi:signal-transduction protein with cAMP-binding, CBS, and nucleotidyltransferase domain
MITGWPFSLNNRLVSLIYSKAVSDALSRGDDILSDLVISLKNNDELIFIMTSDDLTSGVLYDYRTESEGIKDITLD